MHDLLLFLGITFSILILCVILLAIIVWIELKEMDKSQKQQREENHLRFKPLTQEQIDDIHSRGKITPEEKYYEWVRMDLCPNGDAIGSAVDRCNRFDSCKDCLIDLACQKDEHNPIKLSNTRHID